MTIDVVTIFRSMIEQPLAAGVLGRAIERGTLDVKVHDLRDFTTDRHRVVDDVPYGGGPGMGLKPEPLFRALDAVEADRGRPLTGVLTRPAEVRGPDLSGPALKVPDVLLSGHHGEIRRWRKREAVSRTLERRPDLLAGADLDEEEQEILRELQDGRIAGLQKGKEEREDR